VSAQDCERQYDSRFPTVLRRLLGENVRSAGANGCAGPLMLEPAHPLPDNVDVLKILINEAGSFLNDLEPVRKNLRILVHLSERFNSSELVLPKDERHLQELGAKLRAQVLDLGPSIYGIMKYVEWNPENLRVFLDTYSETDDTPADGHGESALARLKKKIAVVECFAERIEIVYQRMLDKLSSPPNAPIAAKYPEEDRDQWIYLKLYDGKTRKELLIPLQEECKKHDWALIETQQGIGYAAKNYALKKHLPPVPSRRTRKN
jgi:hypothetical protein